MARARASKGFVKEPATEPNFSEAHRAEWLRAASAGYVTPTPINRTYYDTLLHRLWPVRHGLPGPAVTEDQLREAIDQHRAARGKEKYKDTFRRMRELQGEEGFTGIIKEGRRYQLQTLDTSQKRPPRGKPTAAQWETLKASTGNRCNNCGAQEPGAKLSPDHRIPRARFSGPPEAANAIENSSRFANSATTRKAPSAAVVRRIA